MKPILFTLALAFGALCFSSCSKDEEDNTPKIPTNDGSVAVTACPDENHPHLIDLGLPSGTKWACCNVGATTPDAYGQYFAWGSVKATSEYTWGSYEHYSVGDRGVVTFNRLSNDIAGTNYDAAHTTWQGKWIMPNQAQAQELADNCKFLWTIHTVNGVNIKGSEITGPNGAKIFFPANGFYTDKGCNDGGQACMWTSTLVTGDGDDQVATMDRAVRFSTHLNIEVGSHPRYYGLAIRPVVK